MAVTVSQQPEDYTPGFSLQLFVALSNQVAQDNFVYTVIVTDLITSENIQYQVAKDPNDDRCYFDAMPYVENFIKHYIPINEYGWQRCVDAIRKIRVNIGETYGATGSEIHTPGSNIDYIVWDAVIDYLDFPAYDPDVFVFGGGTHVYLTNLQNEYTYEDKSNYFYILTSEEHDITELLVTTYDSDGVIIDTSSIANPHEASTTYTDKYLCIDLGHKGLSNIDSGDVTGAYPIITSDVASYEIAALTGDPASGILAFKTYTIGCEREYEVNTVHFWAKNGGFETINFTKRSDSTLRKQDTTYQVNPYTKSGGTMTYSRSAPTRKVLGSSRTEILRLCTDWLTEEQADLYEQILDSAYIYLDSELDYPLLTLNTSSYERYKKANEPLYQLTMEFEYAHQNHRQR